MKFLLVVAAVLASSSAMAQGRQIDFQTVMLDENDKPMMECIDPQDCKDRRPLTLGIVAMRSLANPEQGLDGAKSLKRGQLALRVYKAGPLSLPAEEIAEIKERITKMYGPLVVARAFDILDPAAK
jgi:hypothetical protein